MTGFQLPVTLPAVWTYSKEVVVLPPDVTPSLGRDPLIDYSLGRSPLTETRVLR